MLLQVVAATAGSARERVVMPFSCSWDQGRLRVEPAPEQSYAIVGPRDQKIFTHCVSGNSSQCRTWMVHRFALQCGGARVLWPDLVAAAARGDHGRISIDNGQLLLRLGPQRERDRGCIDGERSPGRINPSWANCQPLESGRPRGDLYLQTLAMPRGYAPLGLIRARLLLTPDAAPVAPGPDRATVADRPVAAIPSPAVATTAAVAAAVVPKAAAIRIPESVILEALAPPELPPSASDLPSGADAYAAAVALEPPTAVRVGWTPRIEPTAVTALREDLSFGQIPQQVQLAIAVGLATLLLIAAGTALRRRRQPAIWRHVDLGAPTTNDGDGPRAIALRTKAEGHIALIGTALERLVAVPPLRNALARDMQASARRLTVVIAATASAAHTKADDWSRARRRLERIAQDLDRLQQITDGAVSSLSGLSAGRTLPRNRAEAYATLGVTEGVSDAILKKLVDALRVSWHPDLARSEPDRDMRDKRIKEINVAWDLITGKRVAD